MPPPIISRQDFIEHIKEVGITTGPGFYDGHAGRRMGKEHRQEPVASPFDKPSCARRDIHHLPLVAGLDRDDRCVHARQTTLEAQRNRSFKPAGRTATRGVMSAWVSLIVSQP